MRIACVALLCLATPAAADPSPVKVTYDRGTILETEDGAFELKVTVRNQLRAETTRPTEGDAEFATRFSIPRSRLGFEGHVFGEDTRYKLEIALGDRGGFGFLRDAFIDRELATRAWARLGMWRRPFNRQEIVSDFASEFNERANTADFVGGGRDLGIGVHSELEKSADGLEWSAGLFNGFSGAGDRGTIQTTCEQDPTTMEIDCSTPTPNNVPSDFGPALVARVGWNHGGIKGYSEGDLEGGPLRFAVGASYKVDLADLDGAYSHAAQVDAMIKIEGFDLQLGGYMMKLATANTARYGGLVQAGYFVMPKQLQVAARFAVAPTVPRREQIEIRGAANVYWQGHAFKLVTDVGVVQQTGEDATTMATDEPDVQARSMLQLVF